MHACFWYSTLISHFLIVIILFIEQHGNDYSIRLVLMDCHWLSIPLVVFHISTAFCEKFTRIFHQCEPYSTSTTHLCQCCVNFSTRFLVHHFDTNICALLEIRNLKLCIHEHTAYMLDCSHVARKRRTVKLFFHEPEASKGHSVHGGASSCVCAKK